MLRSQLVTRTELFTGLRPRDAGLHKRMLWRTIVLFFILVSWPFWCRPLCRATGHFLIVSNDLKKADVVVVLAGDTERVGQAVSLYKQGLADYIIMSGGAESSPVTMAESMKRQARGMGVPEKDIILEPESQHTYQHPFLVAPLLKERGFKSAIIVSSPYHMRRVALLFNRAFKRSGVKLMYCPAANSWFNPDTWWQSAGGRKVVYLEYTKMCVNIFGKKVNDVVSHLVHD